MPYYVFKITQPTPVVKNLEFLKEFDVYKEARNYAREMRASVPLDNGINFKLAHAVTQLGAEEMLMEKRDKTVVMEWEK
ncbi:MAG TPA: hypothetical protein ENJ51_04095 [Leucothrix mucor]|uniref:Uncharacterized protein n=1 Tax=Leucothrix mucor TaxID=45248 RepID=A0A7V2WUD4_LEUMU|nr:hypothetical protein [Leucothrix mucor]